MRRSTTLYCFSPPVMLATFVIEISLLVYTVVRYKMTPTVRAISVLLFFLALFQLAEFNVCQYDASGWSRVGFAAITLLPVVGLHLVYLIAGKKSPVLLWAAYGTALAWLVGFGISDWAFSSHECTGNYAIFRLRPGLAFFYSIYYHGWLFLGILVSCKFARKANRPARWALMGVVFGYLAFLVPTATINTLKPETTAGIPSIMCGFAVLYALVLVGVILPRVGKKKT